MNSEDLFAQALEVRILSIIVNKVAMASLDQRLQAHHAPVTVVQYEAMRLLSYHPFTISDLSRKMRVDPATLVPVIDALERHGFAHRERDVHDRRRVPVALTEAGVALLQQIPVFEPTDALFAALNAMGADASAQLLDLLRQLVRHMVGNQDVLTEVQSNVQIAQAMFAQKHDTTE